MAVVGASLAATDSAENLVGGCPLLDRRFRIDELDHAGGANDISAGSENVLMRVFYNVIGITIGVFVVVYPFPSVMRRINPKSTIE